MKQFQVIKNEDLRVILSNGKGSVTYGVNPNEGADLAKAAENFKGFIKDEIQNLNSVWQGGFEEGRVNGAIIGSVAAIGLVAGIYLVAKFVRSKKEKKN